MRKIAAFLIIILLLALATNAETNSTNLNQLSAKEQWTVVTSDKTVHKIMLVDVTEKGDACGISVDGYTTWINVKKDKIINGVYIKVFEAYPVHSQLQDNDACKVFIGGTVYKTPEVKIEKNETAENLSANQTVVSSYAGENLTTNESISIKTKEEHLNIWQMIMRFFINLFR